MNSFVEMWNEFVKQFITLKGYENVLKGLWATMQIAVIGLLIGILIGTLIAVVRVMPKYKLLPRILDKICVCYIALFRGTPMVVQLLIGYWVLLPALGITVDSGVPVAIIVFGLNSGAYVSEIMRSGIQSGSSAAVRSVYSSTAFHEGEIDMSDLFKATVRANRSGRYAARSGCYAPSWQWRSARSFAQGRRYRQRYAT